MTGTLRHVQRSNPFIKPPLATAIAASCNEVHLFVCLFVCLSACLSPNCKTRFSQKISNLELWSLWTIYKKSSVGRTSAFQRTHYVGLLLKFKMAAIRHIGSLRQNTKTQFS